MLCDGSAPSASKRQHALETLLALARNAAWDGALAAAKDEATPLPVLSILARHADRRVRQAVMRNNAIDEELEASFIDDPNAFVRLLALDNPALALARVIAAMDDPQTRDRAGGVLARRARELIDAPVEVQLAALRQVPAQLLNGQCWRRSSGVRPEVLLDRIPTAAQAVILACWATAADCEFGHRAVRVARCWIRTGRTVQGVHKSKLPGDSPSDRATLLTSLLITELATVGDLTPDARARALDLIGSQAAIGRQARVSDGGPGTVQLALF